MLAHSAGSPHRATSPLRAGRTQPELRRNPSDWGILLTRGRVLPDGTVRGEDYTRFGKDDQVRRHGHKNKGERAAHRPAAELLALLRGLD
jgi:hypothetical protein